MLDLKDKLDILPAVEAVARSSLAGTETGELSLPEPKHVGLHSGEAADLADAEIQFVRYFLHGGIAGDLSHANNIILVAIIVGIHPVHEALRSGRPLDRVVIAKGAGGPKMQEIIDLCRRAAVPVRFETRDQLDRAAATATHQGVIAHAAAHKYGDLASLAGAQLVVILDGVQDPHNLGAVIRTADAAGADAVIIPERRAVGVTEVVAKASAGAVEYVPVVRVVNVSQALESLKEQGFWIYGLDERGEDLYSIEFNTPTAFVLGGEGKGLHEHVKKRCDVLVRIPMAGRIASLNVSVATGVALFEWRRSTGTV